MTAHEPVELSADSSLPSKEPPGAAKRGRRAAKALDGIVAGVERDFSRGHRVLSFAEYLELFARHPIRYGRNAAQYLHDLFGHYGSQEIERPWGKERRFGLFDAPWAGDAPATDEPRLVGHERLQAAMFRVLDNFVREGRANRLMLMHGPNGSAKSTAAACVLRALEEYSQLEEGALYRFHWIFPSRKTSRGAIGFSGAEPTQEHDSFAHLDDEQIDARLVIELRDHPLFLLPGDERRRLLDQLWADAGGGRRPSEWLYNGELCHKNKQVFEALLSDYNGCLRDVLRHVQVERYYVSRRYRVGAVTLGPEMRVDAGERQLTADRSLAALPTSLQATTLFEAHGELVDAAGGVLEHSDLLKRPIDAFRYLQLTLESGEAALAQQTIFTNLVMVGSANEVHMAAFREHPEYPSFRGRLELMRVAYLRNFLDEQQIYATQLVSQFECHVAPHAILLAAEFAVLSRLRRPDASRYEKPLSDIVEGLSVFEKLDLYGSGETPERLSNEERKLLAANVDKIYNETDNEAEYEGRLGASPRLVRTVLLDAAQSADYGHLSPFAVLARLRELCRRTTEFEWLNMKPQSGDYHEHAKFLEQIEERLIDRIERDMRAASGLVEEGRYAELFSRYILHVSAWIKGEKIRNKVTRKDEDADASMMAEVEGLLGMSGDPKEHRETILSMVAAWAIDNPGQEPQVEVVFPAQVRQLRIAAFERLSKPFAQLLLRVVQVLRDDAQALSPSELREAEAMVERLPDFGYDTASAGDAASALLQRRYADRAS